MYKSDNQCYKHRITFAKLQMSFVKQTLSKQLIDLYRRNKGSHKQLNIYKSNLY